MEHYFTHYYYYYYYYLSDFSCLNFLFFMLKIPSSYPLTSLNSYTLRPKNSCTLCQFLSHFLSIILLQIEDIYGLFGLRGREREQSRSFPTPSKQVLSLTLHPPLISLKTFIVRDSNNFSGFIFCKFFFVFFSFLFLLFVIMGGASHKIFNCFDPLKYNFDHFDPNFFLSTTKITLNIILLPISWHF